jgi:4-amino-4-deoxy-L-arabinose transferase-like glycosyltransferase
VNELTTTSLASTISARPAPALNQIPSRCRCWAIGLSLLFFLLFLPTLPGLSRWRGDEQFYTDAAIGMIKSGEYLTPTYGDGRLRFRKPILTYWAVVAGYKVFGFNYFGSRFLFLVAGSLCIWLSFELCLLLTGKPGHSLIATAIMASNLTVQHTSIRSTPDMLLCLFLLTSLSGFVGLIFHGPRTKWYLLAYFGAALAVAAKGLAGLLPVVYAFLYCSLARPPNFRPRELLHPYIVPAAILLAGSWYLWAFTQHGSVAVDDFLGDQVGSRWSGIQVHILENAVVYLVEFFRQLLPWSLLAFLVIVLDWRSALANLRQQRFFWFTFGWILLFYLVFVPANIQRTRYFIPVYPFLALWFSTLVLHGSNSPRGEQLISRSVVVLYMLVIIVVMSLAGLGWLVDYRLSLGSVLLAGGVLVAFLLSKTQQFPQKLALTAGVMVFAYSTILLLITPVFVSSPAPALVKFCLSNTGVSRPDLIPMAGADSGYISQVRALSGGKLNPIVVSAERCDRAIVEQGSVICTDKVLKRWNPSSVRFEKCATGSTNWKARDYLALLRATDRQAVRDSHKTDFFLVTNTN